MLGAPASRIAALLLTEALWLALLSSLCALVLGQLFVLGLGAMLGLVLLSVATAALGPLAELRYGVAIRPRVVSIDELQWLGMVVGVGLAASLIPGYRAYRLSLSDGLMPRT